MKGKSVISKIQKKSLCGWDYDFSDKSKCSLRAMRRMEVRFQEIKKQGFLWMLTANAMLTLQESIM